MQYEQLLASVHKQFWIMFFPIFIAKPRFHHSFDNREVPVNFQVRAFFMADN